MERKHRIMWPGCCSIWNPTNILEIVYLKSFDHKFVTSTDFPHQVLIKSEVAQNFWLKIKFSLKKWRTAYSWYVKVATNHSMFELLLAIWQYRMPRKLFDMIFTFYEKHFCLVPYKFNNAALLKGFSASSCILFWAYNYIYLKSEGPPGPDF